MAKSFPGQMSKTITYICKYITSAISTFAIIENIVCMHISGFFIIGEMFNEHFFIFTTESLKNGNLQFRLKRMRIKSKFMDLTLSTSRGEKSTLTVFAIKSMKHEVSVKCMR